MSDDLDQVLEAGSLLVIETGECSDRESEKPVRMLKSVSKRQLADEFVANAHGRVFLYSHYFLPWLLSSGYVEFAEVNVWHVGSYNFDPNGR